MSQAEKINKESKKDERKKAWQTLMWVLREVHTLKRSYTPLLLIHTLLNLATIYVPILLIAPVLEGFVSQNWQKAWTWGLTLVGLTIALNLLKDFLARYLKIQGNDLHEAFSAKIHEKPMTLDYPSSQDNDAKNAFQRAFQSMQYEGYFNAFIGQIFSLIGDLLSLITSVSLSAVLLLSAPKTDGWLSVIAHPWLATTVTVGLIVLLSLLTKKSNDQLAIQRKRYHDQHITVEKDLNYIVMQVLLSHGNYALYQVYNMIPMIAAWYKEKSKALTDFLLRANKIIRREIFNKDISGFVFMLMAWFIAGIKVMTNAVPLAMVVTYANSLIQVSKSWLSFSENLATIMRRVPYYQDIQNYMAKENALETGTIPVEKRRDHEVLLTMENVSFKYPGSDTWALRNVNVTLDMKKRHAVVGLNGAGKTTFVLLLCRLFDPTEGRVLLNGVDIRKYDYQEYLRLFSAVFQDFQLFAFSVAENVACDVAYDEARVRACLDMAGFGERLTELEKEGKGLETEVASFLGGVMHFSGGEQQKMAIARALYNQGSVMILDEPTAALDPISEADIYAHLNEIIEEKTTVFISHRMSSCRFCSDIIVFNEGEIVERGEHNSLLAQGGLYAE
ncbi:MAG TPA: ABC transporter ATP-binding protein, partial [Anaerolineaceae bacterium]|nr:ABC transporter ATP-binding protein [Anaerolineaceae bacterium]